MQNHNRTQSADWPNPVALIQIPVDENMAQPSQSAAWPNPIALIQTPVNQNAVQQSQSSDWPHPLIIGITPIAQEVHEGALETIHQSMVQERKVSNYWGRVVNRAASLSMN